MPWWAIVLIVWLVGGPLVILAMYYKFQREEAAWRRQVIDRLTDKLEPGQKIRWHFEEE